MSRPRTSRLTRVTRITRLVVHIFKGLYICARHFPKLDYNGHDDHIQRWSGELLSILSIRLNHQNTPAQWPERCMIVTNHISWVDVFVILASSPGVFVAKSDIAGWPVVGKLVSAVGTLYIAREKKSDVRRMNERIRETLQSGRRVAICPEGTTTHGDTLLRFHGALFQPAVDAEATLVPVALRYRDMHGAPTRAASYVGEVSLVSSVWSIATEPHIVVDVHFADPLLTTESDRRALVRACESVISQRLGVEVVANGLDAVLNRPTGSQ